MSVLDLIADLSITFDLRMVSLSHELFQDNDAEKKPLKLFTKHNEIID